METTAKIQLRLGTTGDDYLEVTAVEAEGVWRVPVFGIHGCSSLADAAEKAKEHGKTKRSGA